MLSFPLSSTLFTGLTMCFLLCPLEFQFGHKEESHGHNNSGGSKNSSCEQTLANLPAFAITSLFIQKKKGIVMLCRTTRISRRVSYQLLRFQRPVCFPRSNSTSTSHNGVNTSPDNPTIAEKQSTRRSGDRYPPARTAHIRFWEPVHTIADVWVVKRALEKKYGAILETYFFKVRIFLVSCPLHA